MIDIAVNLTSSQFDKDRSTVIANAQATDIEAMVVVGTNIEQSGQALKLAQGYPGLIYSTAGIHPHDADTYHAQSLDQLCPLLGHTQVVAIGECGLDFYRNFSTRNQQLDCFEAQLQLAAELHLPVLLHQRDAWKDYLPLLQQYRPQLIGAVAHCFTGSAEELKPLLDLDLYIGITGWICDERRGKALQDCVSMIPQHRIMLETDAPYLIPRDLPTMNESGKKIRRNEPKFLSHIARVVSLLMKLPLEQVQTMTTSNARRFFSLPEVTKGRRNEL